MSNPWAVAIAVGVGLGALLYAMFFQNDPYIEEHHPERRQRRPDPLVDFVAPFPE